MATQYSVALSLSLSVSLSLVRTRVNSTDPDGSKKVPKWDVKSEQTDEKTSFFKSAFSQTLTAV